MVKSQKIYRIIIEQHYARYQFDICPEPFIKVDEVSKIKNLYEKLLKIYHC